MITLSIVARCIAEQHDDSEKKIYIVIIRKIARFCDANSNPESNYNPALAVKIMILVTVLDCFVST